MRSTQKRCDIDEIIPRPSEYYSEDESTWELGDVPRINAFTFGWMEDGRLGYPPHDSFIQKSPRPVASFRAPPPRTRHDKPKPLFVCKAAAAGSRHTLFLMINCRTEGRKNGKKMKKLVISGLNQTGLCEEAGALEPVDVVPWDTEEEPIFVACGAGTCFVISKHGNLWSFGQGRYGILGHRDEESNLVPRQVMSLLRQRIKMIAVGAFHAVAATYQGRVYSWGRNDKGQLGRGLQSDKELIPDLVSNFETRMHCIGVSCGQLHSMTLMAILSRDGTKERHVVYCWGDETRGQLGSGDAQHRNIPQENRWLTKLTKRYGLVIDHIAAGGFHNLVLTRGVGQVISWGAGDYGQLGHGDLFDDPKPKLINDLKDVITIAAGLRHSACVRKASSVDVLTWGYNGYGELGLGDTNVRVQPTKVTAIMRTEIHGISCGDRHTVVITSHKPMRARDDIGLRPYYDILENNDKTKALVRQLKHIMTKQGLEAALLDTPQLILPNQPGMTDLALVSERYEKGLRYCLDTFPDPTDWRRKVYEVCYEASMPKLTLKSVCMSCARHCLAECRLRPYIRYRLPGDKCDCRKSGLCLCFWSRIRSNFDKIMGDDCCIGPNQVRHLLNVLRAPAPVDKEHVQECVVMLAEGDDTSQFPRIKPVPFENWYRQYFDEYEDVDYLP